MHYRKSAGPVREALKQLTPSVVTGDNLAQFILQAMKKPGQWSASSVTGFVRVDVG